MNKNERCSLKVLNGQKNAFARWEQLNESERKILSGSETSFKRSRPVHRQNHGHLLITNRCL